MLGILSQIHKVIADRLPATQISNGIRAAIYGKATTAGDTPVLLSTLGSVQIGGIDTTATTQNVNAMLPNTDTIDVASVYALVTQSVGRAVSGSNLERVRNVEAAILLASAARTADVNSADQTLRNGRGVRVTIDVTAIAATPSVVVSIQVKDSISGVYTSILSSAAIVAVSTTTLVVYPGCIAVANAVANLPLARTWRVSCDHDDADSITYSVSADILL